MLRRHSAIINLNSGIVTLKSESDEWSTEIIGSTSAPQYRRSFHVRENIRTPIGNNENVTCEINLWKDKLQVKNSTEEVSMEQRQELINIYNKYRSVFSNSPRKTKNFVCELRFHNSVNFNKKSYPIAQSLEEAVRQEIQRMIEEDIIERSNSPYTSPIVAIPKKDLWR